MAAKLKIIEDHYPVTERAGRLRAQAHMLFADHGIFRYFYNQPKAIAPGPEPEMFRSCQPSPGQLKALKDRGFRTIINLRGPTPLSSYLLEREACARLGLTLVDYRVRSRASPRPDEVLGARDLFERIEYPALMHCKSGADRAGLMAALYQIFRLGLPVEEAARQLSLRYGHFRQAKTGLLDHFFARYVAANAKDPIGFEDWVTNVYDDRETEAAFMASFWPSLLVDRVLRRE